MNQVKNINILEVAKGAVQEKIDSRMREIMENLQDPNCDYKASRTLTIKLTFKNRDDTRFQVDVTAQAEAKLAPVRPISTMLYSELRDGEVVCAEASNPREQIPGQVAIGDEQGTQATNMINMAEAKAKKEAANG